ncbi:hypothetical protein JCM3766R1_001748 [Sporobolomyces carnicolor]
MQRVAHSNLLPTLGRGSRARLVRPLNSRVPSVSGRARFTTAPSVTPAVPFRTHIGPLPSATSHELTPNAHVFWHAPTSTWTYVVVCPTTNHCVIIDPALDYDPATETVSTETADALVAFIHARAYTVDKILESHAHADHLTAARYLQLKLSREQPGVKVEVGIGEKITQTQDYFASKYDVKPDELRGAFDKLWKDGETFKVGHCEATVMHLPGHTADHVGYQFASFVFVGDSIFLPTVGSARADFPFGSPETLFASSQRLLSLPATTRLFSGHHYPSSTESNVCSATVQEQKELNRHLKQGTEQDEFVKLRTERDGGLAEPRLLHQSLQVNIRGGRIPRDRDGNPYLRVPVKVPEGL